MRVSVEIQGDTRLQPEIDISQFTPFHMFSLNKDEAIVIYLTNRLYVLRNVQWNPAKEIYRPESWKLMTPGHFIHLEPGIVQEAKETLNALLYDTTKATFSKP